MNCKLGGMSDEDTDDEYELSFRENAKIRRNNVRSMENGNDSQQNRQDEHELQFSVLSACMSGDLAIIEQYVEAGHNVNVELHTGWTLLMYAASSVEPEVIELLLKHGAEPNMTKDGSSPLMQVCESTEATEEQCLRCISILINAKANPNTRDKFMRTPLMLACQSRGSKVVEELLKHVNDVDATDNEERTALHYATLANKPETVELLLKKNASSTVADRRFLTARSIAEAKGYEKIVALLDTEDNGYVEDFCERTTRDDWTDMFPALTGDTSSLIDLDVADLLRGMGLETYECIFKGMKLNTFVKLTENELANLGMDIALHRKQFVDNLYKFHTKPWSIRSIGSIDRHLPYTLYDGVKLLGNAARQIGIIGSSFQFIKNGLGQAKARGNDLSDVQKNEYRKELRKTEETLTLLKKDLDRVMTFAKKVEKENRDIEPASYIGAKRKKYNWTIVIGVILMTGMYLSKTTIVQRLWNA